MTENERDLGSNLSEVDAHIIRPEEYEEIPELGCDWFARAEPHQGGKPAKHGCPRSQITK